MIAIKEMPYQEKFDAVQKNIALYERCVPEFVRVHLGEVAADELLEEWQIGLQRLPIAGSPQESYQAAYDNWIWVAKTSYRFVRERMGDAGVRKLEQTELHALIQQNKGWPLVMLNLVRLVSPGSAFKMLADQMRYNLQWLTPYTVLESSPKKLVIEIERCKILDYEGTEDVCCACQQVYPNWMANQYMADLSFERLGQRCTCILRPLDWALE